MAERPPRVSIVVPCHNYGRFLGECVRTILDQTFEDFEVLVIDDASTDDTPDVIASFKDRRLRHIRHVANQGLLLTLTEGLLAARGEYVARIDADDRYRTGFLEETVQILIARPRVGLVYGDVALINATGSVIEDPCGWFMARSVYGGRDCEGDQFADLIVGTTLPTPALIGRREVWRRVLPFPDWFQYASISDWYLNLRIAREHHLYYRARTLGDYRVHSDNMHDQPPGAGAASTMLRTLEQLFSEPDHPIEKRRIRRYAYAEAHLRAADFYHADGMTLETWKSYLKAGWTHPSYALRHVNARRLLAACVGQSGFERLKHLRRILAARSGAPERPVGDTRA